MVQWRVGWSCEACPRGDENSDGEARTPRLRTGILQSPPCRLTRDCDTNHRMNHAAGGKRGRHEGCGDAATGASLALQCHNSNDHEAHQGNDNLGAVKRHAHQFAQSSVAAAEGL